jgi:phenylalanyl-tRNA synthetase beta chain
MHEIGQPLHAYDLDKIKSGKIEIKTLNNEKSFITLDGVEIKVGKDDLMVCDGDVPMCIAGVYGGQDHSVNNETKTIFLESAFFNPVSVRKTSKKHNINTDSSYRFERGVDIEMVQYALKRAATLIVEDSDSEIICDLIDEYPVKIEEKDVVLNFEKVNNLIGYDIDKLKVKSILNLLDFKINNVTDVSAGITIPSYRHDVNRECDVVEEILRIHGYNNIPNDEHVKFSLSPISNNHYKYQNLISNYLSSLGLNEIMNNSLVSEKSNSNENNLVTLKNSISNDISIMRPNLIDGILNSISYNLNRKSLTNNFFEFGSIYHKIGKKYIQKKVLGIALNGEIISKTWATNSIKTDFFHLKNIIINLFRKFNLPFSEEISENIDLQIKTENKLIATINQVSLSKLNSSGIKSEVYYSHVDLDLFYSLINEKFFDVKPISKYPKVVRDFSFLINDKVLFNDVRDTVLSISPKYINDVNLTDSYSPKNNNGKISYSFSVSLSSNEKTMSDKEIKIISEKIITTVSKKHEAVIRDQ